MIILIVEYREENLQRNLYQERHIMKKLAIILAVMALAGCSSQTQTVVSNKQVVIDSSTTRSSLDWAGVYEGVLPCADCEGIQTTLTLNQNDTYSVELVYKKGKAKFMPEVIKGDFVWDKNKPLIYLQYNGQKNTLFVGEGYVTAYDINGQPIQSQLNYTLKQVKVF